MTRISNIAQHQQLVTAMLQNQREAALASLQVATGKRGDSYADLGSDAVRQIRLSSVLARENAYVDNARRAADQLAAQDLRLGQLRDASLSLRDAVLGTLAAGEAIGLETAAEAAFSELRSALNADHGGGLLFGGGVASGDVFTPPDLASLVALSDAGEAFANGPVNPRVLVGDERSVSTGIGADIAGEALAEAVRQLGSLLPIAGSLTPSQTAALTAMLPLIDAAISETNSLQADNGARAAFANEALDAAIARSASFQTALAGIEDIDPAEAISRLQAEQNALQASYQVFARMNELSLLNFI